MSNSSAAAAFMAYRASSFISVAPLTCSDEADRRVLQTLKFDPVSDWVSPGISRNGNQAMTRQLSSRDGL